MKPSRNERELLGHGKQEAQGRDAKSRSGNRNSRRPRAIEFDALEPRLLWSATPHPLAPKRVPAHRKPVIVVPRRVIPPPVPAFAAPSALGATDQDWGVQLGWTDHARLASGYRVLRSTDGGTFALITTIRSGRASAFSDASVEPGHTYDYEVQAYYGKRTTAFCDAASVTVPPLAPAVPAGLIASPEGWTSVELAWSAPAGTADGYLVFRSEDGINFGQIAQIAAGSTTMDVDAAVVAGQTYWYKVEAYNSGGISSDSNTATVVVPQDKAATDVSIAPRFGDELVVTVSGTGDSIVLSQSGSTLTVTADGEIFSESVPAAGVFVYTRGGSNAISVGSSVSVRTTIETIDSGMTFVTSAGTNVSAWIDSTDVFSGTATVHRVSSFAGGVSKATGASLADPSDAGPTTPVDLSLWGTGPVAGDINQGEVGDCYFLASLAAFAGVKPSVLTESAVDMGDGTYVVQFQSHGTNTFVRVNGDMPNGPFGGFMYAHPGANNTMWAMVMEKAFADFRFGDNTYASISGGWMSEVYADFGVNSSDFTPSSYAEGAFYNMVSTDLANDQAVTLGTSDSPPDLVGDHAYTLVSASVDSSGVTHYVVRNPWGVSGDSLENAQGYATLTFAQLAANFSFGCQAVA